MRKQDELKKLFEEAYPYRTELHAHTKEKSSCGQVAVCDMIDIYHEKGYDAVVITNHLNPWTIGIKEAENDWEGFIDSFLEPVDIGREYAEKYGNQILLGRDSNAVSTAECPSCIAKNCGCIYGI
jgi:hypothetical protein